MSVAVETDLLGRDPWDPDYGAEPSPLENGEFEFRGVVFGSKASGYALVPGGYSVGSAEWRVQDTPNVLGDGVRFGRDYRDGVTYSWQLLVVRETVTKWSDVDTAVATFRAAWHGDWSRRTPGETVPLRIRHGNGTWRVYGRPRRFSVARNNIRKGMAIITCDFVAEDDMQYSDTELGTQLAIVPASFGGLTSPLKAPLRSVVRGQRAGFVTVNATVPVPLRVRFHGPISDPWLRRIGGWRLELRTEIAEGDWVEVDARRGTVLRNDGASLAGALTRSSPRIGDLQLFPGTQELEFSGVDTTGTATAYVSWRDARYAT